MIISPGAKLNLGLSITGKRKDGYHDLVTLFYPIRFSDSLEIIRTADSQQTASPDKDVLRWQDKTAPEMYKLPVQTYGQDGHKGNPLITYSTSGLPVKGDLKDNLCIRAYALLKADFPELPSVAMHLHKSVPLGAGLGGGSADGAAMLNALNELAGLHLSETTLMRYAAKLGSDCPVFIKNEPQIATGRGEILTPAPAELSDVLKGYTLVLVCPMIHVPTAAAFSRIKPQAGATPQNLTECLLEGPQFWRGRLINDFEVSVFSQFPQIKKIKEDLYQMGASYASMTGSGSAVFAFFNEEHALSEKLPEQCRQHFNGYLVNSWLC